MTDEAEHHETPDDDAASLESNALTRDRLAKYRTGHGGWGLPLFVRADRYL